MRVLCSRDDCAAAVCVLRRNGNHLKDRPSKWPLGVATEFWGGCVKKTQWPDSTVEIVEEKREVVGSYQLGTEDESAFGRRVPNYSVRVVRPCTPAHTHPTLIRSGYSWLQCYSAVCVHCALLTCAR